MEKIESDEELIPNSILSKLCVEKYNEEYAELTESEKEVIAILLESTPEEKQELFKSTTFECIDLIDEKLNESDLDTKERLLAVKTKLLKSSFIDESFEKDIAKLLELKNNLK